MGHQTGPVDGSNCEEGTPICGNRKGSPHRRSLDFTRPGFSGKLRGECLNAAQFDSEAHAQAVIDAWRGDYNEQRPHGALRDLTPQEVTAQRQATTGCAADRLYSSPVSEREQRQSRSTV